MRTRDLDQHFELLEQLKAARGDAREPFARAVVEMAAAAAAAWRIEYPGDEMPEHPGYVIAIIFARRRKDHAAVVRLCEKAQAEGWRGDWSTPLAGARARVFHTKPDSRQ